jgi:hypothetical protein
MGELSLNLYIVWMKNTCDFWRVALTPSSGRREGHLLFGASYFYTGPSDRERFFNDDSRAF